MNINEFEDNVLKLKYCRYGFIEERNYRFAFCNNVLLYDLYKNNIKYCCNDNIDDLYRISELIFENLKENNEIFGIVFNEMIYALNGIVSKNYRNLFGNNCYNILIIGLHVDISTLLYLLGENKKAEDYIRSIILFYFNNYGVNSLAYHLLITCLVGEVTSKYDLNFAIELYKSKHDGSKVVNDLYPYYSTMIVNTTSALIKEKRFDDVDLIISNWYEIIKDINTIDKMPYHYLNLNFLVSKGEYNIALKTYKEYVNNLSNKCLLYPAFCLEIANCYYIKNNRNKMVEILDKGLSFYNESPKNSDIYYKLLRLKATSDFYSGKITCAINKCKEVLKGFENLYGKKDNNYLNALTSLFLYSQDDIDRKRYWKEIVELIDYYDTYQSALLYNNLVVNNLDSSGTISLNYERLAKIAKKAVQLSDETIDDHLKLVARLNYLKCLVKQYNRYEILNDTIIEIFSWLDNFNKSYNYQQEDYFLYYLCKLFYADGRRDKREVEKLKDYIHTNLLPTAPPVLKEEYEIIKSTLLVERDNFDKIIRKKDRLLNSLIENIHNHIDMADYLGNTKDYISFVSQYKKRSYNENIYRFISIDKYLTTYYYGNYLDNPENMEIGRLISGLQIRLLYEQNLDEEKIKTIKKEIEILNKKIEYNYSLNRYHIPDFNNIDIPNNSCLLDYYYYYDYDYTKVTFSNINKMVKSSKFAFYLVESRNKVIRFDDIDADLIAEYIDSFHNTSDLIYLDKLFNLLIAPALPYIKKCETLYISPDCFLSEFSFEFLCNDYHSLLEEFIIIYVSSIFDVKPDFHVSTDKPLIIANPEYAINEKKDVVNYLYCTEIEAKYIANLLDSNYFIGEQANKKTLYENCDATIIHFSTHGDLEEINNDDYNLPLIASMIVLTGFYDWKNNNKIDKYDNGIITAQDISFLTFSALDLVVLSACKSAQGNYDEFHRFKSLRWAFGFSGAKSCITSLFEIDEALAAIFIIIFYQNLIIYPIACALHETKKKCMYMDLATIRKNELFNYILEKRCKDKIWQDDKYPFIEESIIFSFVCNFNGGKYE